MKRAYSGAASGTGAISEWSGKGSTGAGRVEIIESRAPAIIKIQTIFVKPFQAKNLNEFTLEAEGNKTKVTWSMLGSNLYFMKVMGLFTNMDRLLGKHFEAGLRNLKRLAETK